MSCVSELERISKQLKFDSVPSCHQFPHLPSLSLEATIALQKDLKKNKAVGFDGSSDCWIHDTKSPHLISDWWNPQAISILSPALFQCRLIPLNKEYPNLPLRHQFRPIVILSSAFKWLETRFRPHLQAYINKQIDPDQIGFVESCETGMNTLSLI